MKLFELTDSEFQFPNGLLLKQPEPTCNSHIMSSRLLPVA